MVRPPHNQVTLPSVPPAPPPTLEVGSAILEGSWTRRSASSWERTEEKETGHSRE